MSGRRPAPLDGSLLARKGAAAPAITDESPLLLHLDERLLDYADRKPPPPRAQIHVLTADTRSSETEAPRSIWARLARIPAALRWSIGVAAAVCVVAALWVANTSDDISSDRTSGVQPGNSRPTPELAATTAVPVLDGAREREAPARTTTDTEPVAAAPSVGEPAQDSATAANKLTDTTRPLAPSTTAPIVAVNAPVGTTPPAPRDADPVPDIPTTVPKSVSPVPVPKAKPNLGSAPDGPYAVQLASIAVEKRAREEAFRLQKRLSEILGGREISVEKAVVAGAGTTYRLRAGGFASYAEAQDACALAAKRKVDCLALRR